MNALDIAKSTGAKLIFTSTSEIYGAPTEHPQKETYTGNVNTQSPRSCYDEGKRVAETLIMEYAKKHNIRYSIARVFNTYGPFMSDNDGRVISTFMDQACRHVPLTVYGSGTQTRSFCHVSDLVEGLIKLAESSQTGPINLGNPEEITIRDVAEKICDLYDTDKSCIMYKPLPVDDPCRRKPDITLARRYLKWAPTVSLDQGLRFLIAGSERCLSSSLET